MRLHKIVGLFLLCLFSFLCAAVTLDHYADGVNSTEIPTKAAKFIFDGIDYAVHFTK